MPSSSRSPSPGRKRLREDEDPTRAHGGAHGSEKDRSSHHKEKSKEKSHKSEKHHKEKSHKSEKHHKEKSHKDKERDRDKESRDKGKAEPTSVEKGERGKKEADVVECMETSPPHHQQHHADEKAEPAVKQEVKEEEMEEAGKAGSSKDVAGERQKGEPSTSAVKKEEEKAQREGEEGGGEGRGRGKGGDVAVKAEPGAAAEKPSPSSTAPPASNGAASNNRTNNNGRAEVCEVPCLAAHARRAYAHPTSTIPSRLAYPHVMVSDIPLYEHCMCAETNSVQGLAHFCHLFNGIGYHTCLHWYSVKGELVPGYRSIASASKALSCARDTLPTQLWRERNALRATSSCGSCSLTRHVRATSSLWLMLPDAAGACCRATPQLAHIAMAEALGSLAAELCSAVLCCAVQCCAVLCTQGVATRVCSARVVEPLHLSVMCAASRGRWCFTFTLCCVPA